MFSAIKSTAPFQSISGFATAHRRPLLGGAFGLTGAVGMYAGLRIGNANARARLRRDLDSDRSEAGRAAALRQMGYSSSRARKLAMSRS